MIIRHKINASTSVEVEADTLADVFRELSGACEVLQHDKCGLCGGDAHPRVRRAKDRFDYFEMACGACGAALPFGQHSTIKGSLFPKTSTWSRYSNAEETPRA